MMALQVLRKPLDAEHRYDSLFQWAARGDLDWLWLKAQAIAESNLDPEAVSGAGAVGLTQFMARTWLWLTGSDDGRRNPEKSIRVQADYMRYLLKRFNGDLWKAFSAYNFGEGRIRRAGDAWRDHLPRETVQYLQRIKRIHSRLHTEAMGA